MTVCTCFLCAHQRRRALTLTLIRAMEATTNTMPKMAAGDKISPKNATLMMAVAIISTEAMMGTLLVSLIFKMPL